jgi:predicted nucleic acid-binding protein
MEQIFADTFYWLALLNPRDDWHQRALEETRTHPNRYLIVTDGILDKVLNYASTRGSLMRYKALMLCTRLIQDPNIEVVPYTPELRASGLELYGQRADKAYSLTDCISMVVMKQMGIDQVLTHDHHFTQEGFTVLF